MFGRNRRNHFQPKESETLGLLQVLGCDNPDRKGDIIFVHGLAGHLWSTWHPQNQTDSRDLNFWLCWLREDLQQNGIDVGIWTFGYEAARFQFTGAAMPRFDQGSNLLEYLEVYDIGERPLIFITHSMGGLLVKEAIRTAQDFDEKKAIIKQIKGIVFLSTPHTGSHLAKLIDNIGVIARPTVNVRELRAHAPELRSLNNWYRQNVDRLEIATKVFYETKPVQRILVVDEDSANPGIKNVQPVAVPFDHNSIAKPQKNDLVYLGVKEFVIHLLQLATDESKLPILKDKTNFPTELDIWKIIWESDLVNKAKSEPDSTSSAIYLNIKKNTLDPHSPNLSVNENSRITYEIQLRTEGFLLLLVKGTSGTIWCTCPSRVAPETRLSMEGMTIPQLNNKGKRIKKGDSVFWLEEKSLLLQGKGTEEVLAIITTEELTSLSWIEEAENPDTQAKYLNTHEMSELYEFLKKNQEVKVFSMMYRIN